MHAGGRASPRGAPLRSEAEAYEEAFYLIDEESAVAEGSGGAFIGDPDRFREAEAKLEAQRRRGDGAGARRAQNARQSASLLAQDRWERNRILTSGIASEENASVAVETETETRVQLLVHKTSPPFLGRGAPSDGGGEAGHVSTVRDPTSDLAAHARRGSAMVQRSREERDRNALRQRFWEIGDSRLGEALTMASKAPREPKPEEPGEPGEAGAGGGTGGGGDPDGGFLSSFSGKEEASSSAFSREKSVTEQREFLPIFRVRSSLVACVRENRAVVVVGETGSGKTTQLAQYLHEEGLTRGGMLVGCTQPRRVAAMSVARRVAQEKGSEVGGLVGYAIRFEDATSAATRIKYMTDGVLLREALADEHLEKYGAIIMDEAHERSLNTDVLLGVLRGVLARRPDLRLIVTSATLDAERFASFLGGCPIFRIPGRTFPVEVLHAKTPVEDYVEAAVKQALAVHLTEGDGDILVFLSGQEDIECCCEQIARRLEALGEGVKPLLILPMYSQLSSELQARVFLAAERGVRKCVVSTNVAETSLTVDGVRCVIDAGFHKCKVYNGRIGMDALQLTPIARSSADQRAGRAGRTGPGTCYRLYTKQQYDHEMLPAPVPELQRANLRSVALLLKALGVEDARSFAFLDPPPAASLSSALRSLWMLGALDNGGALTRLGRQMGAFPLDPGLAKMLIYASRLGCTKEVLIVAAMLSMPSPFFRPRGRERESDAARERFYVPESDHCTLLNVYLQWERNGRSDEWCDRHFIHGRALRRAREVHAQLRDILEAQRLPYATCDGRWDSVRKAICSAYFHNCGRIKGIGEYVNVLSGTPCNLHPSSALFGLGHTPEYVVYHELTLTSKEYMQCVTSVDAEWLAELGPMFFSIKHRVDSGLAPPKAPPRPHHQRAPKRPPPPPRAAPSAAAEDIVEVGARSSASSFLARKRKRRRGGV